jgi:translation initiation factor 4E
MAGYFSNHSQSRFLTNSSSSANREQSPVPPTAAVTNPPTTQRSRLPSSKHFSTSVSTSSVDEKSIAKEKVALGNGPTNGSPPVHPLRNTYVRILPRVGNEENVIDTLIHFVDGCIGFDSNAHQGTK